MFYVSVYLVNVMVKCNWWVFMDEVHTRNSMNNVDLDVLWTQLK